MAGKSPRQELESLALLLSNFQGSFFGSGIRVGTVVGGGECFGSEFALESKEEEHVDC